MQTAVAWWRWATQSGNGGRGDDMWPSGRVARYPAVWRHARLYLGLAVTQPGAQPTICINISWAIRPPGCGISTSAATDQWSVWSALADRRRATSGDYNHVIMTSHCASLQHQQQGIVCHQCPVRSHAEPTIYIRRTCDANWHKLAGLSACRSCQTVL